MILALQVISQQPPGGRCTLYARYAEVLALHLPAHVELVYSGKRNAHGDGYPSLWLNGSAVQPEDGVILMSADILAALAAHNLKGEPLLGLVESLEVPLERMLEEAG